MLAIRALMELARARLRLVRLEAGDIHLYNRIAARSGRAAGKALAGDAAQVDLVARAVPGVARHIPWRSDCLIQAIAAQRLLTARGIATAIVIGVDRPAETGFAAHAWLEYGDRTVTGGDVSAFTTLLETSPESGPESGPESRE
ncbi:hypothetical protein GCM10009127_03290 [Alteraurantiacibacter aestuarii]|uniref:Lasso peptide biosynthesis B2 protein n=1 Tax=Alteraurantiacibacter aestuarii TaxID=650004 RepID=A0A844ZNK8_9SPHN|nr:lasso peptide biosynthesis B2 protein [Alteraurantiacibacter aestuarii]MXO88417.1 lasso peptide biosynthesis B2 protein [Alteraurantiacibacter aestuarii]